jgi:Serine carboxypeptidase S28
MLSAWFRMKFPHIVAGSHASSAPILFFPGSVSPYAFNELVSRQYNNYCPGMKDQVTSAFQTLVSIQTNPAQFSTLTQIFNTCSPVQTANQVQTIMDTVSNALGTMQMVDYPYATDFLGSLPANPVHTACSWAQGNYTNPSDLDKVRMLSIMLNVFQNSTGTTPCTDIGSNSSAKVGTALDT